MMSEFEIYMTKKNDVQILYTLCENTSCECQFKLKLADSKTESNYHKALCSFTCRLCRLAVVSIVLDTL